MATLFFYFFACGAIAISALVVVDKLVRVLAKPFLNLPSAQKVFSRRALALRLPQIVCVVLASAIGLEWASGYRPGAQIFGDSHGVKIYMRGPTRDALSVDIVVGNGKPLLLRGVVFDALGFAIGFTPWGPTEIYLSVPLWFCILMLGTITYRLQRLSATKPRTLGCRRCGYDLCAHKPGDKCPECGTVIPQPPAKH